MSDESNCIGFSPVLDALKSKTMKRCRVLAVTGVQRHSQGGCRHSAISASCCNKWKKRRQLQVEGDGFWALAIRRPYPSLSDAPASVSPDRHCAPKLKDSGKNKATGLVRLVPTDAIKKSPDCTSRPCHVIDLYAILLVHRLNIKLIGA